jgi:signal peptidase I
MMPVRKLAVYVLPLAVGGVLAVFFKVMKVDLDSMSPTIKRGDFVVVARTDTGIGEKDEHRGNIVIAVQQDKYIVKRLIARSDDVVETRGQGQLFINSGFLPTFAARKPIANLKQTITRVRVPDGYVFVVGDNTYESVDSRSFGVIPIRSVKGRVILSWQPSLSLPTLH